MPGASETTSTAAPASTTESAMDWTWFLAGAILLVGSAPLALILLQAPKVRLDHMGDGKR